MTKKIIIPLVSLSIIGYLTLRSIVFAQQHQEFIPKRTLIVPPEKWAAKALQIIEVKNLDSPNFAQDFSIVVKNVSDKPIYRLYLVLVFPESGLYLPNGIKGSSSMSFGDTRFQRLTEARASVDDPAIKPGELYEFSFSDESKKNFFQFLAPDMRSGLLSEGISKIEISTREVSFGDGTGYILNLPFPVKPEAKTGKLSAKLKSLDCQNVNLYTNQGCSEAWPCENTSVWNGASDLPQIHVSFTLRQCGCYTAGDGMPCV